MLNGTETIRPLRDRVLVKELPWRNETASGLVLPDQAQRGDHIWRALVVAVGPGKAPLKLLRRAADELAKAAHPAEFLEAHGLPPELKRPSRTEAEIREGLKQGFGVDGVKPGDVVLISKYVHSKIGYGDETLCCIAASDILGVVKGEANALRLALETALARLDAAGFAGAA